MSDTDRLERLIKQTETLTEELREHLAARDFYYVGYRAEDAIAIFHRVIEAADFLAGIEDEHDGNHVRA